MAFAFIGIGTILVVATVLITTFYRDGNEQFKEQLYREGNTLGIQLTNAGFFQDQRFNSYALGAKVMVNGRVLVVDQLGTVIHDSTGQGLGQLYATPEVISALNGESNYQYYSDRQLATAFVPATVDDKVVGVIVIMADYSQQSQALSSVIRLTAIMTFLLILIILSLSYLLAGNFIDPFHRIIEQMNRVIEGKFDQIKDVGDSTEVLKIVSTANHMIKRLEDIEDNRKQFVANVSHELKTPLSSMKVLSDSLLSNPDTPPDVYREFLTDISQEVDRETKIINDLLRLVTMEQAQKHVNISKVDINQLIENVMKRLKPLADQKKIEMFFESYRDVIAEVDETKLELSLTNLIENAIKYNKEYGYVNVGINADYKYMYITVKDTGLGIPKESREKIFTRFYRVDKNRSRQTGGTGLGLSIVRQTVLSLNGAIRCESEMGEWTLFTVKLPLQHKSRWSNEE